MGKENKTELARNLGVSRSSLYYQSKQAIKDWQLKREMEKVLRFHPSYGHKRLAIHLNINKKRTLRVMKLFGIKPYRRKTRKFRYVKAKPDNIYPNLLIINYPLGPNHIWTSDFTHLRYQNKWVYLATIMDLFNREIVGFSVLTTHSSALVINALLSAVNHHPVPQILHSDQGSEYTGQDYSVLCQRLGIKQSMSNPGSPWENGYQESFYSHFKLELGDPNRFNTLGELVYHIYKHIYTYNHYRIHTALKTSPVGYTLKYHHQKVLEKVS